MEQVTAKALETLCRMMGIDREKLEFLGGGRGDSDGIVYTYPASGEKMVLKVLGFPDSQADRLSALETRVRFAYHLGQSGIDIAHPVRNADGSLYETCVDGENRYVAYAMAYRAGHNPENSELTDDFAREWGRLTGKAHRATKAFSEGADNAALNYEQELAFFTGWCQDADGKRAWGEMGAFLAELPRGADEYGFIHNDNHQRNILSDAGRITLIDFDCALRQFFIQDITTPAQGLMFEETGGMFAPVHHAERLTRFLGSFLEGYEQENHLSSFWVERAGMFLNYRRLLLFTCMQDWLNTEPELKAGFLRNILNPPEIRI